MDNRLHPGADDGHHGAFFFRNGGGTGYGRQYFLWNPWKGVKKDRLPCNRQQLKRFQEGF